MTVDQPKYKTSDEVDFVIVGSGAAGGVLAKELSTNGFRVVVLEQGPYLTEADFTHNEKNFSRPCGECKARLSFQSQIPTLRLRE